MKRLGPLTRIATFNSVLVDIIFVSILSILEIKVKVDLQPFVLKQLTPACNADSCHKGKDDIDNPSVPNAMSSDEFQSFFYVIASDAQLDSYAGESAQLGKMSYPPPCTASDSCDSCTSKLAHYTNSQMKLAIEGMIRADNSNPTASGGPVPKTLVMNGDLTSYFHRYQRRDYKKLFRDFQGLEENFPGIGNHDYDYGSGESYSFDQWIPRNCNAMHALEYFRGAFCNIVPNFDAKKFTR